MRANVWPPSTLRQMPLLRHNDIEVAGDPVHADARRAARIPYFLAFVADLFEQAVRNRRPLKTGRLGRSRIRADILHRLKTESGESQQRHACRCKTRLTTVLRARPAVWFKHFLFPSFSFWLPNFSL